MGDEGYDVTLLRLAVSLVIEFFSDTETQERKCVFWCICYDLCTTFVSGVLAGRSDTLWLVDLLLIDIFVIFFHSRHFSTAGVFTGCTLARGW